MKVAIYFQLMLMAVFACHRKVPVSASAVIPPDPAVVASSPGAPSIPPCIQQKIDSIKQQPVWNPPAEIHEYEYAGKRVYVISADCCDRFTTAVDADCNYLCAPSGGFTGRGDGKCTDFLTTAKQLSLVWKDDRARK